MHLRTYGETQLMQLMKTHAECGYSLLCTQGRQRRGAAAARQACAPGHGQHVRQQHHLLRTQDRQGRGTATARRRRSHQAVGSTSDSSTTWSSVRLSGTFSRLTSPAPPQGHASPPLPRTSTHTRTARCCSGAALRRGHLVGGAPQPELHPRAHQKARAHTPPGRPRSRQ